MRIRSRAMTVAAAAALAAGGLTAATSTSAVAAPAAALSCYGSAKSYNTGTTYTWPTATAWATTTSNCADINVKPSRTVRVSACLLKSSTNEVTCNSYRTISANTWGTAATTVLDGTKFYLLFDNPSSGQVAY
ncbi:hypothetical protein [Streptomyces hirsutus]|uniref:hypothetical protein n=1 Tax=Streptomyces hirsutus TaxID=35620 RepID=UPI0036BE2284